MTTQTLMTDPVANTTEGQATSQVAESTTTQAPAPGAGEQTAQQQQATGGQGTQGETTEGEKTEADKGENKAPESYDFTAPDGKSFDSETIAAFSEVAKELNLSQDAAQKVLDKMAPAMEAKMTRAMDAARVQWETEAKSDKEFGGEQIAQNVALAKKALDEFGTPELRTLLNETGLGNHPEIIRAFYRAGKAISEDRFVGGKAPAKGAKDPAAVLYPSQQ